MDCDLIYDEWLPYTEYEKAECDVKLSDGSVVLHCWPKAGKFTSLCGTHNCSIPEEEVVAIRYRHYYAEDLCEGHCNQDLPEAWLDKESVGGTPDGFHTGSAQYVDFKIVNPYKDWYYPRPRYRQDPITRETPKIGRNEACPCGSGKKFKKCCLNQNPNQK